MNRFYGIILGFVSLLAVTSGCTTTYGLGDPYFTRTYSQANVFARQGQNKVLKIAVMPFKASTELIGSSVSDMTVTELLRTRKYSLVERGQMAKVLSETELAMAGLSETKAVEAAKLMGAEAVVIGTVDEYGMQAKGGDTYAVVGLSIRLIDCANGKIIWSADIAKLSDDEDIPLAKHARAVVHELVAGLYQNLVGMSNAQPMPPTGITVSEMGLREAVVRWEKPMFPAKYVVERSTSEAGPFASVGEVKAEKGFFTDSKGLKDGSIYFYRVRCIASSGQMSDPSEAIETMTAPPPDAPIEVKVTAPSSRCVQLSWSPPRSDGVTSYCVERTVAGAESWKRVGTTATAAFKDGGYRGCDVADSTKYRYRVIAENRVGAMSVPSKVVEIQTMPPPVAVTGFTAVSKGIRSVPLSWRPSGEADVCGYEIEYAEADGDFGSLEDIRGREMTEFVHGGNEPGNLPDERAFRYRIRSVNNVGACSAWAEAKAVTKPAPAVPSGVVTTTDLAGKVRITWKKNPEPDIVQYLVESKGTGWSFWRSVAVSAECVAEESGLDAGETRIYRVKAVGPKNHQSFWSAEVTGSARPLPPAPTGLVFARTDGGYRVSFVPARAGMSKFKVYRKKFIGSDFLAENAKPAIELSAAVVGEGIDVVVTAIDECGLESVPSEKLAIVR